MSDLYINLKTRHEGCSATMDKHAPGADEWCRSHCSYLAERRRHPHHARPPVINADIPSLTAEVHATHPVLCVVNRTRLCGSIGTIWYELYPASSWRVESWWPCQPAVALKSILQLRLRDTFHTADTILSGSCQEAVPSYVVVARLGQKICSTRVLLPSTYSGASLQDRLTGHCQPARKFRRSGRNCVSLRVRIPHAATTPQPCGGGALPVPNGAALGSWNRTLTSNIHSVNIGGVAKTLMELGLLLCGPDSVDRPCCREEFDPCKRALMARLLSGAQLIPLAQV
jgi:hypothetical protein